MRSLVPFFVLLCSAVFVHSTWAGVITLDVRYSDGCGTGTSISEGEMPVNEGDKPPTITTRLPVKGMHSFSMSDQCPQAQAVLCRSELIFEESAGRFQSRLDGAHLPDRIPISLLKVPICISG